MRNLALTAMLAPLALAGCTTTTNYYSGGDATAQSVSGAKTAAGVDTAGQTVPTDVRRVSIVVRDMEKSLALYRDALGLELNYDETLELSGVNLPVGTPGAMGRLVLLNSNDPWVGWIGLLEIVDPPLEDVGPYPKRLTPGSAIIVVNTDDVPKRCAAAAEVPGVTVTAAPHIQVYPGRGDLPDIRLMGCNVLDPDGIAIEINQILE